MCVLSLDAKAVLLREGLQIVPLCIWLPAVDLHKHARGPRKVNEADGACRQLRKAQLARFQFRFDDLLCFGWIHDFPVPVPSLYAEAFLRSCL